MSDPIDDKAFDEYLGRQSQVSRQYRDLAGLDVPPDIERRVLDHAAQAVEKKHRGKARVWKAWSVPVALAASMVLTLAVVIESGIEPKPVAAPEIYVSQERSIEPAPSADRAEELASGLELPQVAAPPPASSVASPAAPASEGDLPKQRLDAESKARATKRESEKPIEQVTTTGQRLVPQGVQSSPMTAVAPVSDANEAANATPLPAPPVAQISSQRPVAAPPPARTQSGAARDEVAAESRAGSAQNESQLDAVTVRDQSRRERTIVGPRGTLMRRGPPADADSQAAAEAEVQRREDDPTRWLEYIRELRRDQKTEEADRQWSEFRKVYPEFTVEETDTARPQR